MVAQIIAHATVGTVVTFWLTVCMCDYLVLPSLLFSPLFLPSCRPFRFSCPPCLKLAYSSLCALCTLHFLNHPHTPHFNLYNQFPKYQKKMPLNWQTAPPLGSSTSPFLTLPPEIRYMIYEYLVPTLTPHRVYIPSKKTASAHTSPHLRCGKKVPCKPEKSGLLPLLRTSKELHAEIKMLIYSRDMFVFSTTTSLLWFLCFVGQDNTRLIARIEVSGFIKSSTLEAVKRLAIGTGPYRHPRLPSPCTHPAPHLPFCSFLGNAASGHEPAGFKELVLIPEMCSWKLSGDVVDHHWLARMFQPLLRTKRYAISYADAAEATAAAAATTNAAAATYNWVMSGGTSVSHTSPSASSFSHQNTAAATAAAARHALNDRLFQGISFRRSTAQCTIYTCSYMRNLKIQNKIQTTRGGVAVNDEGNGEAWKCPCWDSEATYLRRFKRASIHFLERKWYGFVDTESLGAACVKKD